MFRNCAKKIKHFFKMKKVVRQGIAYAVVAFLVVQCYMIPFALEPEGDPSMEPAATIGDATWTDIPYEFDMGMETAEQSLNEYSITVMSAVSNTYYQAPDTSNPFVAYAMSLPRGTGAGVNNMCATYASQIIYGYYGAEAPVSGAVKVSQISNALAASENWECVYADAACFPKNQTEAQYDAIFDSLTNAGDVVCFVNKALDDYVHCAIAGGGTALIGHLYSSGWDSLRSAYYIDNAVDTRKECSGMIIYRYKKQIKPGKLRVCKNYNEDIYRTNPDAYDIGGANYAVFADRADAEAMRNVQGYCYVEPSADGGLALDNISANARTQPDGGGVEVAFAPGTYYVREWNAPSRGGWLMDAGIYETQILEGQRTTLGLPRDQYANPVDLGTGGHMDMQILGPEQPYMGQISIKKGVPDIHKTTISENENYNFAGVEYTMYKVAGNNQIDLQNPVGVFSLNEAGDGTVMSDIYAASSIGTACMQLPIGWYMIQDTKTNSSMQLNPASQWVEVSAGGTSMQLLSVTDEPLLSKPELILRKYGEDRKAVKGAKYEFCYYRACMDKDPAQEGRTPARHWIFQTDENGEIRFGQDAVWFVEGDAFFTDADGNCVLPAGTLTIREIEAPESYVLDETVYVKKITPGDTLAVLTVEQVITVTEETARGDLEFKKVSEDGEPLADMKFLITDAYGQSQIVWTDAEGYYSTSAAYIPHTKDTNQDEAECGVWFGTGTPDDTKGALPYGTYTIKELRCDANKNRYKTMEARKVLVTEHNTCIELDDFVNYHFPSMQTKAAIVDLPSGQIEPGTEIFCTDTVTLKDLDIGHMYTVSGQLHFKKNGEELQPEQYQCEEVSFEATQTDAQVDVPYKITLNDDMYEEALVFFEYMEDAEYPGEIVAEHTDIEDTDQTITLPKKPVRPKPNTSEDETVPHLTTEIPNTEVMGTVAGTEESYPVPTAASGNTEVKTGDESRLFLCLMIGATAFVGIVMILIGKKKQHRIGKEKSDNKLR